MPMNKDDHESMLSELLNPEIEHSRRTEILQSLRVDYGTVLADFDGITTTNNKLKKDNDDLIVSNSQLFRQIGIVGGDPEKKKEHDQKTFSETVTLESLEKSNQ